MAVRPIEFSAPMVQALLAGRKTQTRRLLKPQPIADGHGGWDIPFRHRTVSVLEPSLERAFEICRKMPYTVGDRLWVKESCTDQHPLAIQEGRYSQPGQASIPGPPGVSYRTIYRVDGEPLQIWRFSGGHPYFTRDRPTDPHDLKFATLTSNYSRGKGVGVHWDPARFMARRFSRLTLAVSEVRFERLQQISAADTIAEGIVEDDGSERGIFYLPGGSLISGVNAPKGRLPIGSHPQPELVYRDLVNNLYGRDVWSDNPWVVVLTFTVARGNIDGNASTEDVN